MENSPSPLPHNFEIEQAFLSIVLNKNAVLEELPLLLKPEHFFHPGHQRIFQAVLTLSAKNQLADPLTIGHYIAQDLEEIGGQSYLVGLAQNLVISSLGAEYAQQIYDLAVRRQLIDLADTITAQAKQHGLDDLSPQEHIVQIEQTLFQMSLHGQGQRGFVPFHEVLAQTLQSAEKAHKNDSHIVGVTTGLVDLDRKLGGLYPSDLVILAGRPSMGKTALATNMALNAARAWDISQQKDGASVAFFSLEMSAEQLALRLLSQESHIPSESVRRGTVAQDDFSRIVQASQSLAGLKLFIDDTPGLTIASLQARARRLKRKHNIGLVVVDYLQLIQATKRMSDGRVQELSEITRQLKVLAKELQVPVLALSQLSRAVEQREDKRPLLSDLRESGSIEQDADVVMFVYRAEYYQSRDASTVSSTKNQAEVIIAKQRHGSLGTVMLHFDGQFTQFSNSLSSTTPQPA